MKLRDFLPSLPVAVACAAIGFAGGHYATVLEWRDVARDSVWAATMAVDGWAQSASMERVARREAEHCRDIVKAIDAERSDGAASDALASRNASFVVLP